MNNEAIEYCKKGDCYYYGKNGYPLNYNKALECYRQAAELGSSRAMNDLGIIYEDGTIVEQNLKSAAAWYYRAIQADQKNATAAYNLGRMYYDGVGIEKDMEKAYTLLGKAVSLGYDNNNSVFAQSCFLTGCIEMEQYKNFEVAIGLFSEAAEHGNIAEAWHNIGYLIETTNVAIDKNVNTDKSKRDGLARQYYEKAANLGYVPSMYNVGRLYVSYTLFDEARPWLEKAASKGSEPAKKLLRKINGGRSSDQDGSILGFLGSLFGLIIV